MMKPQLLFVLLLGVFAKEEAELQKKILEQQLHVAHKAEDKLLHFDHVLKSTLAASQKQVAELKASNHALLHKLSKEEEKIVHAKAAEKKVLEHEKKVLAHAAKVDAHLKKEVHALVLQATEKVGAIASKAKKMAKTTTQHPLQPANMPVHHAKALAKEFEHEFGKDEQHMDKELGKNAEKFFKEFKGEFEKDEAFFHAESKEVKKLNKQHKIIKALQKTYAKAAKQSIAGELNTDKHPGVALTKKGFKGNKAAIKAYNARAGAVGAAGVSHDEKHEKSGASAPVVFALSCILPALLLLA